MTLSKAVYRDLLSQETTLLNHSGIHSELFLQLLGVAREIFDDNWVQDIHKIFQILQLNYTNPKAMNCFIFYDIQDNKLRVQMAKYLLEKGCQRIQKSVYLANIDKREYDDIFTTLCELELVYGEYDSVFMVPIGEYHLAEMKMIGKDVDMSFSRSSQHVLFF
jgi:CRISPR-associated protein Cas2